MAISRMWKFRLKGSALSRLLKVCLIFLAILESDGFLSQLLGIDRIIAAWSFAGLMSLCAIMAISIRTVVLKKADFLFFSPLIAFICVLFVSWGSAVLFPKALSDWLPSLFPFTLIFFFYFLYLVKATARDAANAFVTISVAVSLLLFLDQLVNMEVLDSYRRMSSFDAYSRRVVILKNEVVLGIMFLAAYAMGMSRETHFFRQLFLFSGIAVVLYVQITVMESRLALSSIALGLATVFYFNRGKQRVYGYAFLVLVSITATFPFWIDGLGRLAYNAVDPESNIGIRFETVGYMFELFGKSYGWGVGMMSSNATLNNILFLDPQYNFADGGAFASVFMFGLGGLIIWVHYTYMLLRTFKSNFNGTSEQKYIPLACFAFLLGFTLNPLPLNFFLQPWTILVGGALLYFGWLYRMDVRGRIGLRWLP